MFTVQLLYKGPDVFLTSGLITSSFANLLESDLFECSEQAVSDFLDYYNDDELTEGYIKVCKVNCYRFTWAEIETIKVAAFVCDNSDNLKTSEKYKKAIITLEGLQSVRHISSPIYDMSPKQIYAAMDNELYSWNETLKFWFSIF